ncbi:hypothetical protein AAFC00_006992 [Neodothiora populina]|uniref:Bromo domain-containing protein n=1 Tax=Neodothiora populina TaxID=2781224 RepID=A0ABR3PBV3_9PEZI
MDRNRKRKSAPGASPEFEGSAAKRAKFVPQDDPEATTRNGLQFIDQIKVAKDKTGRVISDLFLDLPDKDELPDYYVSIKLPISLGTVEAKLNQHGYPNMTQLESDLKRMVANAKFYNEVGSVVYSDAERIRKMVSNFMSKNNPAYKDPGYVAFPTPIPGENSSPAEATEVPATPKPATRDSSEQPRKPTVTLSLKNRKASVAADSPSAATEEAVTATPAPPGDFTGMTFQQAQEQIVSEMISHTVDNVQVFSPFVNLPSRSLTDYYQVIKKPVSLSAIKKRSRGQHGREKPTGVSDYKNWDAFENEFAHIWTNARTYNEDGSDMFILANDFEKLFKERLALAKEQIKVETPQQPKITLKGRPKAVLHLGSKGSPAPAAAAAATPGVTVDNDALARQKQAVQTGINGHQTPVPRKTSIPPSRSTSQAPTTAGAASPMKRTLSRTGQASSPPVTATSVKAEKSAIPSPSPSVARPQSTAPEVKAPSQPPTSMAPPAPRVPSASPRPPTAQTPHKAPQIPTYLPAPTTFIDNFTRTKPVADALLPGLTITSHPQLNVPKRYKLDITPSPTFTQQSLTIMLPATYFSLQIVPTVSQQLLQSRQYKLFVTVNGVRLMATSRPFLNGDINGSAPKQVYDASLLHGVNRIEVEIVAAGTAKGGATGSTPLETEKTIVFAHLLRQ